jgi:hypothetical protein
MDIKVGPTGWERVTPLEDSPELTVEVKRLSLEEKMDFLDTITAGSEEMFRFGGKQGREIFKKYIRNIQGLEYNGKPITNPENLFSDNIPADDGVIHFVTSCVGAFWGLQFTSEDEVRDLEVPSDPQGVEAANTSAKE